MIRGKRIWEERARQAGDPLSREAYDESFVPYDARKHLNEIRKGDAGKEPPEAR